MSTKGITTVIAVILMIVMLLAGLGIGYLLAPSIGVGPGAGLSGEIGIGAVISLFFPIMHGSISKDKHLRLKKEKEQYKKELLNNGYSQNVESLVEEEFQRRRAEYAATPKFYTDF